ncbi:CHAD domain-containing protein [Chlorobium sp. N1]|uniref:CHAD domain-containing protein n=1 Tax=Chlorobium sp. N1 TaxID=2491138 RepID=UPI0013F1602F|nr:CHAD domain-containing protein [Chlorobium sp. N1]
MPGYQNTYHLDPADTDGVVFPAENRLPDGYRLETAETAVELRNYYDTFEWQAFDHGLAVASVGRNIYIYDLDSGRRITAARFAAPASFFASKLPEGALRSRLRGVSDIRAYGRLARIRVEQSSWKLLDSEEKTIGTLWLERWSARQREGAPLASIISLAPLRGYHDEFAALATLLLPESALPDESGLRRPFIAAMAAEGLEVGGYSSKIDLQLRADAPIHESALGLLRFTTEIMRRNEEGIRGSIDTEFLHDYRVSIRRARSILAQLKGVFPAEEAGRCARALKRVAAKTGELRDTDVYLLEEERFRSWLPEALHLGLDRFIAELQRRQKALQRSFSRYLASEAYAEFLREWGEFIDESRLPDPGQAPEAGRPTIEIARSSIRKAWKKVIRHGRRVSRETTDEELHAMRIDCKKLRYLLEFFASLFPNKSVLPAVGHLKRLQDNLGGFVDCSVQLEFLRHHLDRAQNRNPDVGLAAAVGGLMTVLHERQEKARCQFHKTFSRFDSDETAELFRNLTTHRDRLSQ